MYISCFSARENIRIERTKVDFNVRPSVIQLVILGANVNTKVKISACKHVVMRKAMPYMVMATDADWFVCLFV